MILRVTLVYKELETMFYGYKSKINSLIRIFPFGKLLSDVVESIICLVFFLAFHKSFHIGYDVMEFKNGPKFL